MKEKEEKEKKEDHANIGLHCLSLIQPSGRYSLTFLFPISLKLLSEATSDLSVTRSDAPDLPPASPWHRTYLSTPSLIPSCLWFLSLHSSLPFPPTSVALPSSSFVPTLQVLVLTTFSLNSLLFLLCTLLLTNFPGMAIIKVIY